MHHFLGGLVLVFHCIDSETSAGVNRWLKVCRFLGWLLFSFFIKEILSASRWKRRGIGPCNPGDLQGSPRCVVESLQTCAQVKVDVWGTHVHFKDLSFNEPVKNVYLFSGAENTGRAVLGNLSRTVPVKEKHLFNASLCSPGCLWPSGQTLM